MPVATSSFISTGTSHSEDYPSPAVTDYLDRGLEAARLVPVREVWEAIKELGRDPRWFRCYEAARLMDLVRETVKPEEAAKRLGVGERRLFQMKHEFWEAVYGKVAVPEGRGP